MDFQAERVSELSCGKCGASIDPSTPKPLSMVECPKCGMSMRVPALFGEFLLAEILGTGAAGIVCKGFDQQLHRQVAIKILSKTAADAELVEQCTREARALAALNHRHVVQVHSIGEYRGQPYIVMELLSGGDVQRKMIGKPNDEIESLDITIATAEGLAAAHRAGLVHMDVKPGNILFDSMGTVKLIDFGVAQVARRSSDQVAGTPYYVAPEVIRGHAADYNADIYSLGSTLFHLLTGRPPFEASDAQSLMKKKLKRDAPNLLDVRDDIHGRTAEVVAKMLTADPLMRYGSYEELLDDLHDARARADAPLEERAIAELVDAAAAPRPVRPARPSVARSPTTVDATPDESGKPNIGKIAGIAGAAVLLLVVAITVIGFGGDDAPPPNPEPPKPDRPDVSKVTPPVVTAVLNTRTPIGDNADWRRLSRVEVTSTSGSTFAEQSDGSLLVEGDIPESDTYTIAATANGPIESLAIELLPDESLERRGPGRMGNVFLGEVSVEIGDPDKPNSWKSVELQSPETDYASSGYPIDDTLDGDPKTAWSIGPRFGQARWATFALAEPIKQAGEVPIRITLDHHPTYQGLIGRFRISVKGRAPEVAATPDPPDPKPTPPTPEPPKPEPPKPKPTPVTAEHNPLYRGEQPLADEGVWHVADVISTTSEGGATLSKLPDGSLLASGTATENDVYEIVMKTPMTGIRGIRIDALPDDALTNGGPGRASNGRFAATWIEVQSGATRDAMSPVTIASAAAPGNRQNWPPADVRTNNAKGWANVSNKAGSPHSIVLEPAEPIANSGIISLRIHHTGDQLLGRFRVSVTTSESAKPDTDVALHRPLSAVGFVAMTPIETTAERATEFSIQDDGSVLVESNLVKNTYTLNARTPVTDITALRLEFLTDPSLPSSGPGIGTGGRIAIFEVKVKAAAADNPTALINVELTDPRASGGDANYTVEKAFDDNARTFWAVLEDTGKPHEIVVRPARPISYEKGAIVQVTLDQRFAVGRFRLSATSSTDPSVLAPRTAEAENAPPATPDAPKKDGPAAAGPFETIYINFGGPELTESDGRVWIASGRYEEGKRPGYVGRVGKVEVLPGGEKHALGTGLTGIGEVRADVPNGKYKISLGISKFNPSLPRGQWVFTPQLEGKPLSRHIDVAAVADQKPLFVPLPTVEVTDGKLNIEFVRDNEKTSAVLSAIIVEAAD